MNLALFFEGTGQGVAGAYTNVTRMRDLCVEDDQQRLHLESGPGTRFGAYAVGLVSGVGWRQILARARKWLASAVSEDAAGHPPSPQPRVYLFGFSRGALIARKFAEELGQKGVEVAYLGLWDTVDSTLNLDVPATCPRNVRAARHAIARDETRRFFELVPLTGARELVFPGSHSDVGGLYEDNHVVADAALAWIAQGAAQAGLRLNPGTKLRARRDFTTAILHDENTEASNLWGALGPVRRALKGIRRHRSCDLMKKKTAMRFAVLSLAAGLSVARAEMPRDVPELLRAADGSPVTDLRTWESKRRGEIRELFLREIYGRRGLVGDAFPRPDCPLQDGCVSYHMRTGVHNLTPYDWDRYMDFADRHGWRGVR